MTETRRIASGGRRVASRVAVSPGGRGQRLSETRSYLRLEEPSECSRFLNALEPNILVWFFVADRDRDDARLPVLQHSKELKRAINELTGGNTTIRASGEYAPGALRRMQERPLVVLTFLPIVVTDELRCGLLELAIDLGVRMNQEAVLCAVGVHAFRFQLKPQSSLGNR